MTDILTPEQRARCMRHIRSRNTRPEMLVRQFLFAAGCRFRVNLRRLPGTPDIVLRKYRTVIFVNGCFWHGHQGCRYYRLPHTNVDFWRSKIERNQKRDRRVNEQLRDLGWNVITIWECQLKPAERQRTLNRLLYTLSHIYLQNAGVKVYPLETEEHTDDWAVAAEPEAVYKESTSE